MRGKNKKIYKSMLKERNKPPPPVKSTDPVPNNSLFSSFTQIMSQGMAFGAGSDIGHRIINGMTGLWSNKENTSFNKETNSSNKEPIFNQCDDLKREFVSCIQNNEHCNEAQSQYLECLDKLKNK